MDALLQRFFCDKIPFICFFRIQYDHFQGIQSDSGISIGKLGNHIQHAIFHLHI